MKGEKLQETWMIFVDESLFAPRFPTKNQTWTDWTDADIAALPGMTFDFGCYSPSDGHLDISHVPNNLPRQVPKCVTGLAVYHDSNFIYIIQRHDRPAAAIPELATEEREDFSLVIQLGGHWRGVYFGMNEKAEHIGCAQRWDVCHAPDNDTTYPFSLLQKPGAGPSGNAAGILGPEDYTVRLVTTEKSLTAIWRIARTLLSSGINNNTLRISAARTCYRTGEMVCWGSAIAWSPRMDRMGTIQLLEAEDISGTPHLRRIDMDMDYLRGDAALHATWDHADAATLERINTGTYAAYNQRCDISLNGIEVTLPLAQVTTATFPIADGWNHLEVITAMEPLTAVTFQSMSSKTITPPAWLGTRPLPTMDTLRSLFAKWHAREEGIYQTHGAWGVAAGVGCEPCLCHGGAFHMLPYILACQYLEENPVYRDRVREGAERIISRQDPEGWFPELCLGANPSRFRGGAFATGSVGETMAMANTLCGEKAYLESSRRAADSYRWYTWEFNENYAAFALWHLAELFEQKRVTSDLERAIYYARHFAGRDIGPCGAQDAHNYYTGYGNITLKGLARLLFILPQTHDFYEVLRARVLRFANQTLSRLQPDGLCAGRNRRYVGYTHLAPGLFEVARALPEEARTLEPALAVMVEAAGRFLDSDTYETGDGYIGLVIACMARHLKE